MKVKLEMTRQVGANTKSSIVGTGLASLVMFLVLDGTVPDHLLMLWLAAQILLLGARFYFSNAFNGFNAEDESWAKAVDNFTRAMFFVGLGWGMASVLAALYGSLLDQVVVLAILLGVVGAAIGTVAQVLSAYTVLLISAMTPQVLSFLLIADEKNILLGLMTIVYSFVVYRAGYILAANIRDLVEVREDLASAKSAAEEANMAKSQFLSRMSHELRTPLNAIIGFSQLQEGLFDEATSSDLRLTRDHILQAGKHLLTLIEDIMDVVKIEQSKLDVPLEPIQLSDIIEASLDLIENQAKEANVELHYEKTEYCAIANAQRLQQVMVNLLTNAIKYNLENGSVTVRVTAPERGEVEIEVEDAGIGIDPEDQEKVFAPFSRLTYAAQSEIDGTGIGLTLCKFLVELMNGKIGFKRAPHKGTVFWVRLPQGDAITSDPPLETRVALAADVAHTILYIDDNLASRQLLQMMLDQYANLQLFTANNAEQGIELAKNIKPELIFIDINLPDIDGAAALEIIKSMPVLNKARVIALSADAMPTQIENAMNAGFDQYLTKPVEHDQIIEVIAELQMQLL